MPFQTATNRSTIKTRSSAKRERLYDVAKYGSVGKGPRTKTRSPDPVAKRLAYEVAKKTPARAAKTKSPYASMKCNGRGPSLSQNTAKRSKSRTPTVLSPPYKRRSTNVKTSRATRPDILSPLASFSPNLLPPSRTRRAPLLKKNPTIGKHAMGNPLLNTIPKQALRKTAVKVGTPLAETTLVEEDSSEHLFEDAYPLGLREFDFDRNFLLAYDDDAMMVYISFITGYEDVPF